MKKLKRVLSIFIAVLLIWGNFTFIPSLQQLGVYYVYGTQGNFQGPAGANFIRAGAYPVKETGLVYFVIEYLENTTGNPTHAYVAGNFNGWNQTQHKMTWQQDTDGKWKLITAIPMQPGTYEYKFILHWGADPVWINHTGWNGSNSTFTLEQNVSNIVLRSSKNNITPGENVYFALDEVFGHGGGNPIQQGISWSVTNRTGVSINNGVLTVAQGTTVSSNQTLTVTANYNGKNYTKNITLQASNPNTGQKRVYYFRYDNAYEGQEGTSDGTGNFRWNVFAWGGTTADAGFAFSENTDFGKVAYINSNDNFIIRKRMEVPWKWTSEWFEQTQVFKFPQGHDTVYIVEGDNRVFTDFRKAMTARRPKALYAVMDSKNKIEAILSGEPKIPVSDIKVHKTSQGSTTELATNSIQYSGGKLTVTLGTDAVFAPSDTITISNQQFAPSKVHMRGILDEVAYYEGKDLGIRYDSTQIRTRLWAPTASKVELLVYNTWDATNPSNVYNMTKSTNGTWIRNIDRNTINRKFYLYRLTFDENTEFQKITYAVDPNAQALALNGVKGAFVNLNDSDTKPVNWKPTVKPPMQNLEDAIIYELHIRDFSIGDDSGISVANKGTYRAFTERGTTIPGTSIKTGIDSLVELGITHVHLLPFYDFKTVDESRPRLDTNFNFNWGYDPQNYNAPEGSYSTNPHQPEVRIREAREMIQSLHDAGIRVIKDVVYNHTYDADVFEPIVPGYYYRTDHLGRFINDSGCGNTIATERKMVRKFIIDSLEHWANNYNLDGFRFDLMGLIDTETMIEATKAVRRIDPTMMMYGEPWGGFVAPWTGKGAQRGYGFGAFNDDFRNAIRGGNSTPPSRAYVTGGFGSNTEGIWKGVRGSIDTFTQKPHETINYVSAHDNYTIWDQIIMAMGQGEDRKFFETTTSGFPIEQYYIDRYGYTKDVANPMNTITQAVNGANPYKGLDKTAPYMDHYVRRSVLASGIVLTSQGIPFIHAGEEHLRSKYGDHNSYKSPDIINNKDFWNRKKDHKWVFDYYAGLIKLRKEHPAFRMTSAEQINTHFEGLSNLPTNVVGYRLKNNANGDSWKNIVVIYNPNDWNVTINLPGTWNVVVDDQKAGTATIRTASNSITVHGTSMMVLYGN